MNAEPIAIGPPLYIAGLPVSHQPLAHDFGRIIPSMDATRHDVSACLNRLGYAFLGGGAFGEAWAHPAIPGSIIKISRANVGWEDGWLDYARIARRKDDNPLFPKIKRMVTIDHEKLTDTFFVAEIERLEHLWCLPQEAKGGADMAVGMMASMIYGGPVARAKVQAIMGDTVGDLAIEACYAIREQMASTHYFDLHTGNVMFRPDPRCRFGYMPVITDPVSGRSR